MSPIQLVLGLVKYGSSHACVKQGKVIMPSVSKCIHTVNSGYLVCKKTG